MFRKHVFHHDQQDLFESLRIWFIPPQAMKANHSYVAYYTWLLTHVYKSIYRLPTSGDSNHNLNSFSYSCHALWIYKTQFHWLLVIQRANQLWQHNLCSEQTHFLALGDVSQEIEQYLSNSWFRKHFSDFLMFFLDGVQFLIFFKLHECGITITIHI